MHGDGSDDDSPCHMSVATMPSVGGHWGGPFVRWTIGYAFHAYCFGYCVYAGDLDAMTGPHVV